MAGDGRAELEALKHLFDYLVRSVDIAALLPAAMSAKLTRVLWNTYPVHCLLHEIMWDSAHSWRRLQVRQNTYFCTVDNGDCIVYNQASMNMDLLN